MLALKTLMASALLALAVPAFAAPVTLNFEAAPIVAVRVGSTYAQSLGITFTPDAWMVASASIGGDGNFYGPGTEDNFGAVTLTPNFYPTGPAPSGLGSFTVEVLNGFDDFFSLRYAGETSTTISAYNKAGDLVKTITGGSTLPCSSAAFVCNWEPLRLDIGDTDVFKIVVEGTIGKDWYDNFSFGRLLPADSTGELPEPGGVALSLAALGALAWSRKRQTQR